jgi:hypothetical protein
MRFVRFAFAFLGSCCLAVTVEGREVVTCKSPDGKFALRHVYSDQQPYTGDTAIIEVSTRKTILPLDSNWSIEGTAEHPHLQNRRAEITLVARLTKGCLFCGEWERPRDPGLFPKRFVIQRDQIA